MRKAFWFFILICYNTIVCNADTIDFWQIYYNNIPQKSLTVLNKDETLLFKTGNIKQGDSLTVKYFKDAFCNDCLTTMLIEDEKHQKVVDGHGKGTFNPISISIVDLLYYKNDHKGNIFEVYYWEENERAKKRLLFRIKLE